MALLDPALNGKARTAIVLGFGSALGAALYGPIHDLICKLLCP